MQMKESGETQRKPCENCPEMSTVKTEVTVDAQPTKLITGLKVQILIRVDDNTWRINWENRWENHSWFVKQFGTEYQLLFFKFQTDFYTLILNRFEDGFKIEMIKPEDKEGFQVVTKHPIAYLGSRYRDFFFVNYSRKDMFKLKGIFVPMVYLRDVLLGSDGIDIELRPKLPILIVKR